MGLRDLVLSFCLHLQGFLIWLLGVTCNLILSVACLCLGIIMMFPMSIYDNNESFLSFDGAQSLV